jgi:hypothetical protein
MLRKWMVSTAVAGLLAVGVAGAAMAQDTAAVPPYGVGACTEFVDANGDGVCDNAPQDGAGAAYGRSAQGGGQGINGGDAFVDADGDGQCDLWQDADGDGVNDAAPQDGSGSQNGRSSGGRGGRR